MSKLIQTVSSVLAAASVIALALGCSILSSSSWAAEPLTANCDDCTYAALDACGRDGGCEDGVCLSDKDTYCGCTCNYVGRGNYCDYYDCT